MTIFILTLIGAFAWLLYETDFMRVRLGVGAMVAPESELEYKTWDELQLPSWRYQPFWLRYRSDIDEMAWVVNSKDDDARMEPLCGWDWLKNTMHVIPLCRVEFRINGTKQTITNAPPSVLGQVMKIYKPAIKQAMKGAV